MGLRSFFYKNSSAAKRAQHELAKLKAANASLKEKLAALKARPPRLPLESAPAREEEFRHALAALAADAGWQQRVTGWPEMTARIGTALSESDIMLVKSHAQAYVGVGLSALECLQHALRETSAPPPRRILDFGCGYGRVLRFLAAAWPEAEVYGTDMDAEGLGFCTHHFSCYGFRTDLENGPRWVKPRFDLIWVGSVFTHLGVADCQRLIRHLAEFLAPGGLVVFTTHGALAQGRMKNYDDLYRLEPAALDAIVRDCETAGHGYADYPKRPGYGVSATSEVWVNNMIAEAGLQRRLFLPAGWAQHQDVFAAQRPS